MKWINRLDNKLDPINWPEEMLGYHRDRWLAMVFLFVAGFCSSVAMPVWWKFINWLV